MLTVCLRINPTHYPSLSLSFSDGFQEFRFFSWREVFFCFLRFEARLVFNPASSPLPFVYLFICVIFFVCFYCVYLCEAKSVWQHRERDQGGNQYGKDKKVETTSSNQNTFPLLCLFIFRRVLSENERTSKQFQSAFPLGGGDKLGSLLLLF